MASYSALIRTMSTNAAVFTLRHSSYSLTFGWEANSNTSQHEIADLTPRRKLSYYYHYVPMEQPSRQWSPACTCLRGRTRRSLIPYLPYADVDASKSEIVMPNIVLADRPNENAERPKAIINTPCPTRERSPNMQPTCIKFPPFNAYPHKRHVSIRFEHASASPIQRSLPSGWSICFASSRSCKILLPEIVAVQYPWSWTRVVSLRSLSESQSVSFVLATNPPSQVIKSSLRISLLVNVILNGVANLERLSDLREAGE